MNLPDPSIVRGASSFDRPQGFLSAVLQWQQDQAYSVETLTCLVSYQLQAALFGYCPWVQVHHLGHSFLHVTIFDGEGEGLCLVTLDRCLRLRARV